MYDALMSDAPYDIWAAYIDGLLGEWFNERESSDAPLVLDLACGTGNITLRLAKLGYDLIGVDASEDMLAEAQRKSYEQSLATNILFLAQDMRELDLYGTVDAVVCVCDGMNYILNDRDLAEVFRRVRLFLNPGGVFIFDMNTEYKFKEVLKDNIFEARAESGEAYVWENRYDPQTNINEYHMTFTMAEGEAFSELHRQRAYPPANVRDKLLDAGFSAVAIRDGYSGESLKVESSRVVFIAS
ncbi:MAG: class I SAM-dependent methyltransferase [Defluviitaleaceae bacterium]|nr:class I SAM-dependent methyltransferase [Defluviitaleaceae bacterium]